MWPRRVLAGFLLLCSVALYCRNVPLTDLGSARAPGDFKVYLTARDRVAAGEDPYRLDVYSEYKYSPAMVLPYSVLPRSHDAAWLINKAILVLTWAVSIWAGVLGIGAFTWRHLSLVVLGVALSWKGLLEAFDYGQVDVFLLAGAVTAAIQLARRPRVAGAVIGLLPALKLPWAVMILPFLFAARAKKKTFQVLVGFGLGVFAWLAVVPVLFFGREKTIGLTRAWFYLLGHQPAGVYSVGINQSPWLLVLGWQLHPWLQWGALLWMMGFLLAVVLRLMKVQRLPNEVQPLVWVTPWLIIGQLMNPLAWRWGSLLFVGAPLGIERSGLWENRIWRSAVGGIMILLILIQMNPVVQCFGWGHWTDLHPYGTIALYWIGLLLLGL